MIKTWQKLEHYLSDKIQETFNITCRPTKGSGNQGEKGDSLNSIFRTDCKYRNTKNLTINISVWQKLLNTLPIDGTKVPMLLLENKDNKRFIILNSDDFFKLCKELLENKKKEQSK